jgi:hypothetical protein
MKRNPRQQPPIAKAPALYFRRSLKSNEMLVPGDSIAFPAGRNRASDSAASVIFTTSTEPNLVTYLAFSIMTGTGLAVTSMITCGKSYF